MNSNTFQKNTNLRIVKTGAEISELESWEMLDAEGRHEELKIEAIAAKANRILKFTLVAASSDVSTLP